MSEGCWVQFWDGDEYQGATLRFDGPNSVNNLDDYNQSDGRKEGDEPDSLETGSRTWIVVYKDDNYEGGNAMFGPNTRIGNLDDYGVGGNISSFKMFDYRPTWFVDSTTGNSTAIETDDSIVNAASANNYLRTNLSAALNLIPVVGGFLGTLLGGFWPDVNNQEQLWGCFQNYLNQAIAGVYWQSEYQDLAETLDALYRAAQSYVDVPDEDPTAKVKAFDHFYNLANDDHSYFVDETTPERKLGFLVPYATLRLAALRENLQHYAYYHDGNEPSETYRQLLVDEIQQLIIQYQGLLVTARDRIIEQRLKMISVQEPSRNDYQVVDFYNGWTGAKTGQTDANRHLTQYKERVGNELAMRLAIHDATGQLWAYLDPENTNPVEPPVIEYSVGPFGDYQGETHFEQMAAGGRVSRFVMWSGDLIDSLQLSVNGVPQGKAGGNGGTEQSLDLSGNETISAASGYSSGLINKLEVKTSTGRSIEGGTIQGASFAKLFEILPLPGSEETALIGISGEAAYGSASTDNIKALTFHWRASLSITSADEGA